MERNIICIVSPQSIDKSALISLPMFRKLAGNFKRFGRITAGTKISDRETASLKLALMGACPHVQIITLTQSPRHNIKVKKSNFNISVN